MFQNLTSGTRIFDVLYLQIDFTEFTGGMQIQIFTVNRPDTRFSTFNHSSNQYELRR